mgnify:CR=1 FL=1
MGDERLETFHGEDFDTRDEGGLLRVGLRNKKRLYARLPRLEGDGQCPV